MDSSHLGADKHTLEMHLCTHCPKNPSLGQDIVNPAVENHHIKQDCFTWAERDWVRMDFATNKALVCEHAASPTIMYEHVLHRADEFM